MVREYRNNGAEHFTITHDWLKKMLDSPEIIAFLRNVCDEMQVHFDMVHGLFGPAYDLNTPRRRTMLENHRRAMKIAASFGCRTYVVHVGAYAHCVEKIPLKTLRPLAVEALQNLLAEAEKQDIILAVENSFEPPNSPQEILRLIAPFGGNPFLGICYDTGHANCMRSAPGKDPERYHVSIKKSWQETGIIYENNAWEFLKERVVSCHIHDNNGYSDQHGMPFDGTIEWQSLMPELFAAPQMIDFYAEVCMQDGENWAGKLLAPAGGYSIRQLTETFSKLGF